jgi:hypothetical protein
MSISTCVESQAEQRFEGVDTSSAVPSAASAYLQPDDQVGESIAPSIWGKFRVWISFYLGLSIP